LKKENGGTVGGHRRRGGASLYHNGVDEEKDEGFD